MPENQNVEWKERWKDEYLEWICAFANTDGGKLLIGVDDNGKVVGVSGYEKLLRDIPNKICNVLGIVASVKLLEENGVPYIEISVPPYPVGISCRGVYYCRSGSTKQVLAGPALESFLLRRRGASWDNMPFPSFTIDDVDDREIQNFCKLAAEKGRIAPELLKEPKDVLLEKLHLTRSGYLTNAAMLLFSKDPQEWQQGAYIKIGYFESDSEVAYQDEIHGPLLEQVDSALDLIYFKYLKAKIFYKGIQRIERYFVPRDALREALINAVCHKRYESCIPIQVSVYDDRLYVANDGGLPEGWTAKKLMDKHDSKPYNPYVATVLYYAGFIESWGRGIEKICAACRMDGVYDPIYTVDPGDVMVEFTAPEDRIIRIGRSEGEISLTNYGIEEQASTVSMPDLIARVPNPGIRVPDQDDRVPNHGIIVTNQGIRAYNQGVRVPDHGVRVPDHGVRVPDQNVMVPNSNTKITCSVTSRKLDRSSDEKLAANPENEQKPAIDELILSAISESPSMTKPELAQKIGISRKTVGVYLKKLKTQKKIERVGNNRTGYWKII